MNMTLGDLIKRLEKADPNKPIALGFGHPHSYRGYYEDLAFEPVRNTTVGAMLACAKEAMGKTYTGYKGGEYEMGEYTDVWLSHYGHTGETLGQLLLSFMLGEPPEDSNG